MSMKITIIGNGSASPRLNRHPSAQVLEHGHQIYLIDCGEGTQYQLIKNKIKYSKIDHIFISHLHGDHFFGLFGLITSFYLNRRSRSLHIYANELLEKFINEMLEITQAQLEFNIVYHFLIPAVAKTILETDLIKVDAFPLSHRIDTHGFVFVDKHIASNSYAYCSDTQFSPEIIQYIRNVRLLYHEATFGDDKQESASIKFHSTARQAAQIASMAKAKQLIVGHFSAKYSNLDELLFQAREVFTNTNIAMEGATYEC